MRHYDRHGLMWPSLTFHHLLSNQLVSSESLYHQLPSNHSLCLLWTIYKKKEKKSLLRKKLSKLIEKQNRSAFFCCPLHGNFGMKRELSYLFACLCSSKADQYQKRKT